MSLTSVLQLVTAVLQDILLRESQPAVHSEHASPILLVTVFPVAQSATAAVQVKKFAR